MKEKAKQVHVDVPFDIVKLGQCDFSNVPIEKMIKQLQELKSRCRKAGYCKITLDIWSYECVEMDVKGYRDETEKEKARRLKRVEHAKKMNEAKRLKKALKKSERALYEELKAKFEPEPEPDVMTNE